MASNVIDSRNFGKFPNHPRTVQGTAIYDIVAADSRAVPALTPSFAITSVANAVGANTAYTGTFTPAQFPNNSIAEISGFTNAPNNGAFQVVSCTATTLTLANAGGLAEAIAATAIPYFPVDSRTAGAPVESRVSTIVPLNSRT